MINTLPLVDFRKSNRNKWDKRRIQYGENAAKQGYVNKIFSDGALSFDGTIFVICQNLWQHLE